MKYLIVANGPFLSTSMIVEASQGACVIALDGAANKLARLGIMPDIILGDLDSFQEEASLSSVKKIKLPDQNFTDFQKAIQFAMFDATQYGLPLATEIHAVCATGGRFDHDQANIRTLKSAYNKHCSIYLHNDFQTITYASDEIVHIRGKHHDYCGLFGMPEATMIVKNGGLEYGSDTPFRLTLTQISSSNRLVGNEGAIVDIQGEALIIHPLFIKTTL